MWSDKKTLKYLKTFLTRKIWTKRKYSIFAARITGKKGKKKNG